MSETAMTKTGPKTAEQVERAKETSVFVPRVDIKETEAEVVVTADMPGVDETSVQIDLQGSELSIRGGFVPQAPEGYVPTYSEYENGDYERTFTLGDTINREGIKAVVKNGVLRVVLPKAKEAQPRRITVNAG